MCVLTTGKENLIDRLHFDVVVEIPYQFHFISSVSLCWGIPIYMYILHTTYNHVVFSSSTFSLKSSIFNVFDAIIFDCAQIFVTFIYTFFLFEEKFGKK